ncbi:Ig-like domain-containing protein, partial [Leucobacter sp. Ag1]|uniref:Ig-like domain-containing protein n=3 Tax=Leucobacter TaxID=55968 RepID=UPI0018CEA1DB
MTDEHGQKVDHSFTVDVADPIAELTITGPKEGATVDTDTPNVTGTAQPGAKVTVTGKDGETLAETTAGEDGKWSVDLPKLPNGTHEITVKDDNGKSDDVSFVVNAITPIQLTGPETSESKRPVVTGTGHPGSNIELKDVLGKTIGIGTVAADGKWSITPTTDLGKGANVVTAHQTAPGGKTSEATGTIQVTAKDPLVVTGPTPGATVESETPNVSGTAEPGSKITVTGPDGEKLGETTTDENGDWSLQLPVMPEGETSITVTDEHGGKEEIEFTVPEHFDDEQDADSQADPGAGANGTDEDSKDSNTNSASEQDARANMNASASAAASANADGQGNAKIEGAAQAAAFSDATAIASAAADVSAKAAAQAAALAEASTNASANIDANASAAASGAALGSADSTSTSAANANASAASESNAAASAKSAATTTSSSDAGSQAAGQASAAGATSNTQGANSGSNSNDRANANAAASAAATAKADDNSNASVKGAAEAAAYADNTSQASAAADISAEAAAKAAATPTASSDTTANLTSASNSAAEAAARAAAQADNSSSANASASQRATTNANAASKSAAITNASSNAGANAGGTSTGKTKWKRLGGANRFETAVQVSKDSYPRGAKSIVIARSDLAPDALSAAPFAVKQNAPVLLTPPTSLVKETKAEIKRLKADTVYIAGANGAISASVEAEIRGMGVKIVRMAGSDRYETSLKIAQTGWKNGTEKAF